jgi:Na+-transporting methylmalonyl-CoA/oxaloacetate decarboxylase gamma subunit
MDETSIDWGEVGEVVGVGFGMVFLILGILALIIWIVGIILQKRANLTKGNNKEVKP